MDTVTAFRRIAWMTNSVIKGKDVFSNVAPKEHIYHCQQRQELKYCKNGFMKKLTFKLHHSRCNIRKKLEKLMNLEGRANEEFTIQKNG